VLKGIALHKRGETVRGVCRVLHCSLQVFFFARNDRGEDYTRKKVSIEVKVSKRIFDDCPGEVIRAGFACARSWGGKR